MTPRGLPGRPFRSHFGLPFFPGGQPAIVFAPLGAPRASATEFFGPRGASQERSRSALGGHLAPNWRPGGFRRPPGGDFGALGGRFWSLRGSLSEASGASCGAFRGARAHASASAGASGKRKRGRKRNAQARAHAQNASAGPKAKDSRPQGLKVSRARRDVRSTLIRRAEGPRRVRAFYKPSRTKPSSFQVYSLHLNEIN